MFLNVVSVELHEGLRAELAAGALPVVVQAWSTPPKRGAITDLVDEDPTAEARYAGVGYLV